MSSLIVLVAVIFTVALMTLSERKVMGALQRRIGPNKVGYQGLLQPFTDGLKLIQKETTIPLESNGFLFLFSPFITFYLALLNWQVIPLNNGILLSEMVGSTILILIAISEISIQGIVLSGWSANSKYPFLGSLRSTAQMISYSLNLSIILLIILISLGEIDLMAIMQAQEKTSLFWPQLPIALLFIVSAIAETNRAPFDQPEAESEQVAGFFTEHSAISFAFFFLAEYTNMLVFATLFFIFFFGKSMAVPFIFFYFWLRASLPRFRFDQLLKLGWLQILPLLIGSLFFVPFFILQLF